MDPLVYGVAVSVAVGTISSLVFAVLWKTAEKDVVAERAAHDATKANLVAAQAAVKLSETDRSNQNVRLEALIVDLKAELATMEHSTDPEEQRKRLERLSGG